MDYLAAFLNYNFLLNKRLHKSKNPDSIYLAGFTIEHIQHLKEKAIEVISEAKRPMLVVECSDKTWPQAVSAASGLIFKTNSAAYSHLEELQKATNTVLVVVGLSRCKTGRSSHYARSLIKTLDDAHFGNVYPQSDLIFIDYASFLEKHWSYIGSYLRVNTLVHSLHFYPMLSEQPLRAVK